MKKKFRGRVWKFGHNIDTDIMAPGKYENLPLAELSRHCLEPIDDRFAPEVRKNDVIVISIVLKYIKFNNEIGQKKNQD